MAKPIKAIILQKLEGQSFHELGQKLVNPKRSTFTFWDREFVVDKSKIAFMDKKGRPVLTYDFEKNIPLDPLGKDIASDVSSSYAATIYNRKGLQMVLRAIGKSNTFELTQMIFPIILGLAIGIVVGKYI